MNSYNSLDLNKIKELVCFYSSIFDARAFIAEEEVPFNPLEIRKNLTETNEALTILKRNINVSFDGIENVNEILDKADKGIILTAPELLRVLSFHNHADRIKRIFADIDDDFSIKDYSDSLTIASKSFDIIFDSIDNNGEVKRTATKELESLYDKLDSVEKELYNKAHTFVERYRSSLQEPSVYTRNGRVSFLIKNSDKNKYQGYTYGTSSSGLATYVEPGMFVEINNRKISLEDEIEKEIVRILTYLTYLVSEVSDNYRLNFSSLVKLNVVFSKAHFGLDNMGIIPEISGDLYFSIKDVCHPLLDRKKAVTNTYRLSEPYKGIVISGSNTGGKTVGLKTIGLSIVMSYLGIPIIASEAKIPLYDDIFVDIDDNQSIINSLSTFSAHITNINSILNNASRNSLILIDELISGTDPKEAQAISLAIIEKIKEIGSIFVITTHFDDIKNYCFKDKEILLSSVGFNMDTLLPTYKYLEDSIGSSNAIEIASRYFDDQSLIDKSRSFLKDAQSKEDELLNLLSHKISENESLQSKLLEKESELEAKNRELEGELEKFNKEREKLKEEYLENLNTQIETIKNQALEKLEQIKEKSDKKIVKEIEELKVEGINDEFEDDSFEVGDNVRIADNEQIGFIEEINNDRAIVNIRGIKVNANLSKLKKMPKVKKTQKYVEKKRVSRVSSELNLVGERVEEALIKMETYLDSAYGAQMTNVKIIHGIGTGALRSAIRERLKKIKYVKNFGNGDFYDGGSAVTMVEFKK